MGSSQKERKVQKKCSQVQPEEGNMVHQTVSNILQQLPIDLLMCLQFEFPSQIVQHAYFNQSMVGVLISMYYALLTPPLRPSLCNLRTIPSGNLVMKDTPGLNFSPEIVSLFSITTNTLRIRHTSSQTHTNSSIPPTVGRNGWKAEHLLRPTFSDSKCYGSTLIWTS